MDIHQTAGNGGAGDDGTKDETYALEGKARSICGRRAK